jgi:hypothetical protein
MQNPFSLLQLVIREYSFNIDSCSARRAAEEGYTSEITGSLKGDWGPIGQS